MPKKWQLTGENLSAICGVNDMANRIRIRLVKSTIGRYPYQRKTAKALGLGKINSVVEKEANSSILGMVRAIEHMVEVEEIK